MTDITASIVAKMRHPVLVLDRDLTVALTNPAFRTLFRVSEEQCAGHPLAELGNGQWNIPALLAKLAEVRDTRAEVTGFRVEHDFPSIGPRTALVNARYLEEDPGPNRILIAIEDITERERTRFELEGQKEFADKIVDASRDALLILHWDLRVHSANQTFYDTFRVDPAETEGRLVYELGHGQWDIPRLRELLEDVLPENNTFDDFEVAHDFPGIGQKTMLLNARRIDHMQLILLAIEDVTERERSIEALRASEERLRKVLETEAVGVLFFDGSGTVTGANDAFLEMTGYTRADVESGALSWRSMTPEDWMPETEAQRSRLAETGRIAPFEKQYIQKDGTRRWMMVAGRDLGDGTVCQYMIDIDARKQAETERELLARELSHRVKNTLAVVQSLAKMTNGRLRTIEEYREAFLGRLDALARSHSLLLEDHWRSTDLRSLVELTVSAFKVDHPEMIVVEGDSVMLTAKQAMGLGLVLHELGTNAVKHGALSVRNGHLRIAWWIEDADGGQVHLTWREREGPPVSPPDAGGFGTEMIQQTCSYELDGEARLDFAPEGLACAIAFPLEQPGS